MKLLTSLLWLLPLSVLANGQIIIGKDQAPINKHDYAILKEVAKNAELSIDSFRHYKSRRNNHYIVGPEGMLYWDIKRNGIIDGDDEPETGLIARLGNSYITDKDGYVLALAIRESHFSDTSILNKFKKLVAIDLSDNQVTEVNIFGLPNLRHLRVFETKHHKTITRLSNVNTLAYFKVYKLIEPNFSKLSGVKGLHRIEVVGMSIESFAGLENMPNLKILDVSLSGEVNNENARALKGIPKWHQLERLKFTSHTLTNIDQLSNFSGLKRAELWLTNDKIKGLSSIGKLKNLEELEITSPSVTDFSFLKSVPKLKKIVTVHSPITSLAGLNNAPNLEHLELNIGKLTQISHLEQNIKLKTLILNNHKIEKLSGLSNLKKLKTLDVSVNKISKFEGLDSNICLEEIGMASNPVKKLDNVYHLPLLYLLDVDDTKIREFPRWKELKRLHKLRVKETQLDPDTFTDRDFWWVNVPIEDFDLQLRTSPKITDEERRKYGCI